jgi:hypothetical protein
MAQTNSVGEVAAIPDRNQTVIDLGYVCAGPTSSARAPTRRSKRGAWPNAKGRRAPLSTELWHCTAYPGIPEATWAQPLSREELS